MIRTRLTEMLGFHYEDRPAVAELLARLESEADGALSRVLARVISARP